KPGPRCASLFPPGPCSDGRESFQSQDFVPRRGGCTEAHLEFSDSATNRFPCLHSRACLRWEEWPACPSPRTDLPSLHDRQRRERLQPAYCCDRQCRAASPRRVLRYPTGKPAARVNPGLALASKCLKTKK